MTSAKSCCVQPRCSSRRFSVSTGFCVAIFILGLLCAMSISSIRKNESMRNHENTPRLNVKLYVAWASFDEEGLHRRRPLPTTSLAVRRPLTDDPTVCRENSAAIRNQEFPTGAFTRNGTPPECIPERKFCLGREDKPEVLLFSRSVQNSPFISLFRRRH